MLHFKEDENLPGEAAELLRSAGHDAVTVNDQGMSGASDSLLATRCRGEGRTLVTQDMDFTDIRKGSHRPREQRSRQGIRG
jgi:predicted nuclease of predicted toxin-antitoxin system